MDDKDNVLSDEQIAEQEKVAVAEGDEFRAKVVAELGLSDDDDHKELIDKVVEREAGLRKGFGNLLGKYKNLRSTAKPAPTPAAKQENNSQLDAEQIRTQTETTVKAQLEQRDLDEMEYPDEIKADIKKLAQLKGISVRKAAKDPYIQHLITEANADNRNHEATVTRTPHATPTRTDGKPEFNMATDEGRKAFKEWKASRRK